MPSIKMTFIPLAVVALLSGCSAYRASSNIDTVGIATSSQKEIVIYTVGTEPNEAYQVTQPINVSVKKLTLFHDDPTKEQANAELEKRALALKCDAVVKVFYKEGVGLTTWGYIDAEGYCAKFD